MGMGKKGGGARRGVKDATEILQGLGEEASNRILGEIEKKNPALAQKLRNNLLSIEDLKFLTISMIRTLLREISPESLGLALRGTDQSLVEFFTSQLPTALREELESGLKGGPRLLSHVLEARERILLKVQEMIKKGQIVINKDGKDTFV